jgi:hypothetical protein
MRLKSILLGAALAGATLITSTNLVQAQVCPRSEVISPSKETRTIRQNQLGYRFEVPKNYRVMAVRNNGVLILDPNSFERAQCFIRNKVATEYPYSISVYTRPVQPGNRSLTDLIKQENPLIENIKPTTVAKQTAVSYNSGALGYTQNLAFLTPDRRYMITVTAPFKFEQGRPTTIFNKDVFDAVLSSFTFNRG